MVQGLLYDMVMKATGASTTMIRYRQNIGNHRADQIVDISAQAIEIHDLRQTDHNLPKPLNPFGIVLLGLDRDENADAEAAILIFCLLPQFRRETAGLPRPRSPAPMQSCQPSPP
jgi:hypothetical protein